MWICAYCGATTEDEDWETCWKCSLTKDPTAPGYDEARRKAAALQELRRKLMSCQRCDSGQMQFVGVRRIPYDLSGSDHVDYESESYTVYACQRCGKTEFYLSDLGAELRGDPGI